MSKTAFITGITGQTGSYLAELLLDKGYKVVGLMRRTSTPNTKNIAHIMDKITYRYGDLCDYFSIVKILHEFPDISEIYHLGAQSFVKASFDIPDVTSQVNYLGTLNMLEATRTIAPSAKIYCALTSECFGSNYSIVNGEKVQNELTLLSPNSPYGVAKLASYHLAKIYNKSYGMKIYSAFSFNHSSPRRGMEFVTRKVARYVAGLRIGLHQNKLQLGNLDSYRDWTYAGDIARAIHLILQLDSPVDLVIGSGETHSVRELVQKCFKYVGIDRYQDYIEHNNCHERPCEVEYLRSDPSKAMKLLSWKPQVSFDELLAMMIENDQLELLREKKSTTI